MANTAHDFGRKKAFDTLAVDVSDFTGSMIMNGGKVSPPMVEDMEEKVEREEDWERVSKYVLGQETETFKPVQAMVKDPDLTIGEYRDKEEGMNTKRKSNSPIYTQWYRSKNILKKEFPDMAEGR